MSATSRGSFLRMSQVQVETGLSRGTIYRLIRTGEFPAQARLSARCTGWWSEEVDAWKQKRRAGAAPS